MDRRGFLGGLIGASGAWAYRKVPLLVRLGSSPEPIPPIQDPRLKALADVALDAARTSGARYTDVRLTHTRKRVFDGDFGLNSEAMAVGVRAMVAGYWGFASGPAWSREEMARLGSEAVHQAKANTVDGPREVTLAPVQSVPNGHWVMPARDPFEVSPFEISDFLKGLQIFGEEQPNVLVHPKAVFVTQGKLLATSEGSYCSQQLYRSWGSYRITVVDPKSDERAQRDLLCLSPAGLGWELWTAPNIPQVREHGIREEILQVIQLMKADLKLPVKPVEVGRYDTIFDAASIQNIAAQSLGQATQLDRALGFEANESGTSYLNDPTRMVGTYAAGSQLLTFTGSRSVPGGAATVRWDDEGVPPDECTLVKDGVLQDLN